jgi:ribonuclease T2
MRRFSVVVFGVLMFVTSVSAQVRMDGTFEATQKCPAVQSIRKGTNPGNIVVEAGKPYRLLGKNKTEATHYWIEIPAATPDRRWVALSCGRINDEVAEPSQAPAKPKIDRVTQQATGDFYILAVSWQPAFCEAKASKRECASQTPTRYDATHFTLHGLWPQPRSNVYCGVSQSEVQASSESRWQNLPDLRPALNDDTEIALARVMPGSQSFLDRHEWTKHGTCYPGREPEKYFADSLRLMEELNSSAVQKLMADNIGKTVSADTFRRAVDESFGAGAADRMRLTCKQDGERRVLVEVTIGLKGDISAGTALKDLIAASSPTDPGCPSFVVDPVGLQ